MNRLGETHATLECHLAEGVPPHWRQVPACDIIRIYYTNEVHHKEHP